MILSYELDVFFNACVTAQMLEKLEEWVNCPVIFSDWKMVEYSNGGCAYFVSIKAESETAEKVINALWDNLKIPLIAYESKYNKFDSCVRWAADTDGIRNVLIAVEH